MALSLLRLGHQAEIKAHHATGALKERFESLGLVRGAQVKILARSPFGETLMVEVDGAMRVALRRSESDTIAIKHD